MKKLTSLAAVAAVVAVPAIAEPTVYGKGHIALENHSVDSTLKIEDHDSRIGVKGSENLEGTGLEAFYRFEYGTAIDDGDVKGETFSQRNIFVGVKGGFGSIQAGRFDTPLKASQNKFDVFGDTVGDIKYTLTNSDNRESNGVAYSTPTIAGGFKATVAMYMSEVEDVDDGTSISVAYNKDALYASIAYDSGIEDVDTDVLRAVAHYKFNSLQVGGLYESEETEGADSLTGYGVSVKYTIDKLAFKGQVVQGDIVSTGGQQVTLGADYNFSKAFSTYVLFTQSEADNVDSENVAALGAVYKF